MDLYGIFQTGESLLTAVVDLGTYAYDIYFLPLKDVALETYLPFISELVAVLPESIWDSFLGDLNLIGLFVSAGAVFYVILFLFKLLLEIIDLVV